MTAVRLARRAERDLRRTDAWWRDNRPAAPELFLSEVGDALRLLRGAPAAGPLHEIRPDDGVRRVLLPQTRFHAYYRLDRHDEVVVIVAFWSTQRGRTPML